MSSISSVKNSPANTIKLSAAIFNLVSFSLFDLHDSDKPENINISLLSGCCNINAHYVTIKPDYVIRIETPLQCKSLLNKFEGSEFSGSEV